MSYEVAQAEKNVKSKTSLDQSVLQRKCDKCQKKPSLDRSAVHNGSESVPPKVHEVLRSPGQPLDPATRAFMEPRFGHDFSHVRLHTDNRATESARAVNGLAYTVGGHIVFGAGRYDSALGDGTRLLAHELTHVLQQDAADVIPEEIRQVDASSAAEMEADRVTANLAAGADARTVQGGTPPTMARFSDTGHHVVEEAGLAGAGFSKSQIEAVERGNVQRDYSQIGMGLMGRIGNAFLLCRAKDFGGYRPVEHFDNYMWDAVTGGWRSRGGSALGEKGVDIGQTPIDYISSELDKLSTRGDNNAGLEHLGNAFHTVEDFFAHSNFVELMQGDTRYGAMLITGNPVGPSQSVSRIFEAISPRGVREHYRAQSEAAIDAALPGSHTQIAHDDPTTRNYTAARRLAALVIQDLGTEVLAVMKAPEGYRSRLMRERVVAKLVRYLRPPNPKDKWWETLTATDAGRIDERLKDAELKTPTMVNQCMLSPLKNLEASRDSPMALPLGVAIPSVIGKNQVWFQLGGGVTRPIPFDPLPGGSHPDPRGSGPVIGVQITGTHDFLGK